MAARLPEWQISMNAPDTILPAAIASRQTASYIWVGFLTIVAAAVLAGVGGRILQRQMRIANLKTDLVAPLQVKAGFFL